MRTRFAPSPTGTLHVGGLRTAFMSYLLAKQTDGQFLLRIEDTDQTREVPGAVENILRTLEWAGISPDEGVILRNGAVDQQGAKGPYIQSQRLKLYQEHAKKLHEAGCAYYCFCTKQRLDDMRKQQEVRKHAPMYDRTCLKLTPEEVERRIKAGEPHVLRLKIPHTRTFTFNDDIRGEVSFGGHTIDDQVLLKSDGFPTYHLAHVVDDHLMEIDLVIRGEEWLSSLPKHLFLFECFGWTPPRYAHVPLLLNRDRTKLSKRQNSVAAEEYRDKGYLPEALMNFLVLLGWNPGTTQELFTLPELIQAFSLERVQKAGAIFDTEKLDWLQGQWIRRLLPEEFSKRIQPLVGEKYPSAIDDREFPKKAVLIQERITFFPEAADMLSFFYEEPHVTKDLLANEKQKVKPDDLPRLLPLIEETLSAISDNEWNREHLEKIVRAKVAEQNLKLGQFLWPMRAALTGRAYSPGAFEVAEALGKEKTLERIAAAKTTV